MSAPQVAMILAAGFGTRMRPLTDALPKPLIEIAGRTLLDRALDRAREAGCDRAVINGHYRAEMIAAHLAGRSDMPTTLSREAEILETGGGVKAAAPLLGPDPVFVLNSDCIWTGPAPLLELAAEWDPERMDSLLLLCQTSASQAYTRNGDFFLDKSRIPVRRGNSPTAPYVYTGAQILNPAVLADWPEGPFSLNSVWDALTARGRLFAAIHRGGWVDVGAPECLAAAERAVRKDQPA